MVGSAPYSSRRRRTSCTDDKPNTLHQWPDMYIIRDGAATPHGKFCLRLLVAHLALVEHRDGCAVPALPCRTSPIAVSMNNQSSFQLDAFNEAIF